MDPRPSYSVYFNLIFIIVLFVIVQIMFLVLAPALRAKNLIDDKLDAVQRLYLYTDCSYQYTVNLRSSVSLALCTSNNQPIFVAIDSDGNLLSTQAWSSSDYEAQINRIRSTLSLTQDASVQLTYQNQAWQILVQENSIEYLYDFETRLLLWKADLK